MRGVHPDRPFPKRSRLRAWIELSWVLADTQKARGRNAAEAALALARQLDPRATATVSSFITPLCRAASAAAQTSDPAGRRVR